MKKTAWVAILAALIGVFVFGVDYFSAMRRYEEFRKKADTPLLEAVVIEQSEQEFLDDVRSSWTPRDMGSPNSPMIQMCELAGFEPTVEGLRAMFTHEVPPFALLNIKRNLKEVGRAGGLSQLKPIATREKFYWKSGVLYMMLRDDVLECYEDTDTGVSHVLYKK